MAGLSKMEPWKLGFDSTEIKLSKISHPPVGLSENLFSYDITRYHTSNQQRCGRGTIDYILISCSLMLKKPDHSSRVMYLSLSRSQKSRWCSAPWDKRCTQCHQLCTGQVSVNGVLVQLTELPVQKEDVHVVIPS